MSPQNEIKKYLDPVVLWITRHISDLKNTDVEKKKLILFREFVKEQLPNENPRSTTR